MPLFHSITPRFVFRRLRRSPVSLLSVRLAASVMGVLALGLLVAAMIGWRPLSVSAATLVLLCIGAVVYGVGHRILSDRITLAYQTLRQIRQHKFENLEQASLPKGDELNALVWQVYRTGLAMQNEIATLKKIENYRREFLGNVSHELKTPIFSIKGFSETLLNGALEDTGSRASFVQKILRNADRLDNLVQDLAEISKIETGELAMEREPLNLGQLIREVVESIEPVAEAKAVHLSCRIPADLPLVMGDYDRLRQVFTNLIDNGIKYNNDNGHVEVVVRALSSGDVKVSVVDDGIGIAPQHVPRLTERFYRVDKSRSRRQGGTGLGLAIVKHIIGAHNSNLKVESRPGGGSTFGFTLEGVHETKPASVVAA